MYAEDSLVKSEGWPCIWNSTEGRCDYHPNGEEDVMGMNRPASAPLKAVEVLTAVGTLPTATEFRPPYYKRAEDYAAEGIQTTVKEWPTSSTTGYHMGPIGASYENRTPYYYSSTDLSAPPGNRYDAKGRLLDAAQEEFQQFFPQEGWVEHNPELIWESVLSTLITLTKKNNLTSSDIASIGITNQRETTIVWNRKTGEPISNAIVWQDRRTAEFCNSLSGEEKLVQKKTGLTLDPYFSATKLHWLLNNIEGAKELAINGDLLFGTVDTYLIWKLTEGRSFKTDVTNASRTMLFNIEEQEWDEDLLNLFQVPKKMLPEVCDNVLNFGFTSILGGEITIGGVAGDQQAALIGQCCFDPGEVKSTFGTGCFMIVNTGEHILTSENKLLSTIGYRINGETTYALEGSIFVAGSAV